jgi:hypothetical protein
MALKSDKTVVVWGNPYVGVTDVPADLSQVVAIAASDHSLALKKDGTVVAWGYNNEGQATVPAGLSNVIAIAADAHYSMALKKDGTVVAWGKILVGGDWIDVTVPAGLSGVTAIAAGYDHSLALKSDGTVVAWGENDYGQATVPADLPPVFAIAAGNYHSLALRPMTLAAQIESLRTMVEQLLTDKGLKKSLTAKLDAALAAIEKGKPVPCNHLAEFINEVHAHAGKQIPDDIAARLIQAAREARTSQGCR